MPIRPLFNLEEGLNPKIGSALSANFSSILLTRSQYLGTYIPFILSILRESLKKLLVLGVKKGNYQISCA